MQHFLLDTSINCQNNQTITQILKQPITAALLLLFFFFLTGEFTSSSTGWSFSLAAENRRCALSSATLPNTAATSLGDVTHTAEVERRTAAGRDSLCFDLFE